MKKRWLPRIHFSLRTLLLLVLTTASAATMWWNWGPWTMAFVVHEPGTVAQVVYSDDDRFILISHIVLDQSQNSWSWTVDVRRADTGAPYAKFTTQCDGFSEVRGDYLLVSCTHLHHIPEQQPLATLFNWRTGKQLAQFPGDPYFISGQPFTSHHAGVSLSDTYVAAWTPEKCAVFKLPAITQIAEWPQIDDAKFLNDERLMLCHPDGSISIHDLRTGIGIMADCHGKLLDRLKPWDRYVPIEVTQQPNESSCLLDTITGHVSQTIAGSLDVFSPDARWGYFVDQATSSYDLYELSTGKKIVPNCSIGTFSSDSHFVVDYSKSEVLDTATFNVVFKTDYASGFSKDGAFLLGGGVIGDSKNGRVYMSLYSMLYRMQSNWAKGHSIGYHWVWSHHSSDFAIMTSSEGSSGPNTMTPSTAWKQTSVWHLRRPYQWYGPAYLPEFWLTILLSAALIYSLLRDRKNA